MCSLLPPARPHATQHPARRFRDSLTPVVAVSPSVFEPRFREGPRSNLSSDTDYLVLGILCFPQHPETSSCTLLATQEDDFDLDSVGMIR